MCVICFKPAGVEMPGKDILDAMMMSNRDGFGFVSTRHNYKTIQYGHFLRELANVETDENAVIHFRYATHGSIRASNSHPFFDPATGFWFAHNGVLDIDTAGDLTDSETFFRLELAPRIEEYGFDSSEVRGIIEERIGSSRFALYDSKNDNVSMFGRWVEKDGIYYSNLNWYYNVRPCRRTWLYAQ